MTSAKLSVAIYDEGPGYKRWSLFVEGDEKLIFNIIGSSTQYQFEMRISNARDFASEIITLCEVDASQILIIEDTARNAEIHNEYPAYNCQDFVLELMTALEKKGMIDPKDKDYIQQKRKVRGKQEGFE